MRFETIKGRNIGPFRELDIDFSAIPGVLVAVTGKNGAGKSTLLELLAGGMYRSTPTRGTLADLATARDSTLDVGVRNGKSYTMRHHLDALSRKVEAVVLDADGVALTEAGKVREVDAWVAQHLTSPEVLYTSSFAPQGSGGFLDQKPTARKAVLLRVLGIEHLEAKAEQARARAAECSVRVGIAKTRLDDEQARVPALDASEQDLAAAREAESQAAADLRRAEQAAKEAERAAEAADRVLAERNTLVERMSSLNAEAREVETRHDGALRLAGRADEVRVAREQLALTETSLVAARGELARAREHVAAERERETQRLAHGERLRVVSTRRSHLLSVVAGCDQDMVDAGEVEAAQAAIPEAETNFATMEAEVYRLQAERDSLRERYTQEKATAAERLAARGSAERVVNELASLAPREWNLRTAVARLEELTAERERLVVARDEAARRGVDLRTRIMSSKDDRIGDLREALVEIAGGGVSPVRVVNLAAETLSADHVARVKAESAPAELQALEDSQRAVVARLNEVDGESVSLYDAPRQLADLLVALEVTLPAARESFAEADAAYQAARVAMETTVTEGKALEPQVSAAQDCLDIARKRLSQLRRTAERSAVIVRAAASRAAAQDELAQIEAEAKRLRVLAEYDDMDPGSAGVVVATSATVADIERQAQAYQTVLAESDAIAAASAQVEAAQRDRLRIETAITELRGRLANLPEPLAVDEDGCTALERAEYELGKAQGEHRFRARALVAAESTVERARAGEARITELHAELERETTELSDWTRLGQDLGKDGIQALEIDAAGPELTAIANDLLHTCVSRRWTLEVRTQRASADGKRQIEGCDVVVIDTERGREGEAETFSGGERVLLGEALSLALSVLACRRHGVVGPTLVRDESGAALDASNGRAYIAMLRRAAEFIGADKVLFVSHSAELQELADARIHVADGCATVIGGAS